METPTAVLRVIDHMTGEFAFSDQSAPLTVKGNAHYQATTPTAYCVVRAGMALSHSLLCACLSVCVYGAFAERSI